MSIFAELNPPYSTIVADPPWHYAKTNEALQVDAILAYMRDHPSEVLAELGMTQMGSASFDRFDGWELCGITDCEDHTVPVYAKDPRDR